MKLYHTLRRQDNRYALIVDLRPEQQLEITIRADEPLDTDKAQAQAHAKKRELIYTLIGNKLRNS